MGACQMWWGTVFACIFYELTFLLEAYSLFFICPVYKNIFFSSGIISIPIYLLINLSRYIGYKFYNMCMYVCWPKKNIQQCYNGEYCTKQQKNLVVLPRIEHWPLVEGGNTQVAQQYKRPRTEDNEYRLQDVVYTNGHP